MSEKDDLGADEPPAPGDDLVGQEVAPEAAYDRVGTPETGDPVSALPAPREREVALAAARSRKKMRDVYGYVLLGLLFLQVAAVHVVFIVFAVMNGWEVEPPVFIAYLGTTLGETIGLAHVVVRHLFPTPR